MLRFIHLTPFDRKWNDLGLDDEDLRALQVLIADEPARSPVVRDTGGLRKVRYGRRGTQGKRGGFRVGYACFPEHGIVLLITVYAKNDKADLSAADRKAIAGIIDLIRRQLEHGSI